MLRNVARLERALSRNLVRCVACGSNVSANVNPEKWGKSGAPAFGTKKDFFKAEGSDADTFGQLSEDWRLNRKLESMPEEEGDKEEVNYLDGIEGKTKLTTKQYADMIKQMVREKRIRDALDVLEVKMLKEDKTQPENYIFNLLISACARVGYTKKAFQLFNKMKSRGLKVTGGTYSSLFNACANSPWQSDGLQRATHLRELIKEKAYVLNQSNYHAMIKAFGRCGDLMTAFNLVDEMLINKVPVTSETINFLLQACIADKEAGFRHALLVWRKLLEKKIEPSVYTYNLLLRSVRDCGLGQVETLNEDLERIVGKTQTESNQLSIGTDIAVVDDKATADGLPNLLATQPTAFTVANLRHVNKPKYRLMLLGGCRGFLEQMSAKKIKADIKTVTQLLEIIPSKIEAENDLMAQIEKYDIELDIDFCNMLIKKRNKRDCRDQAKEVLKLISRHRLNANIVTYGVLAMGCRGSVEIKQLLSDIEESGFRVNIEIAGTLLNSAVRSWDVGSVLELMDLVLKEDMRPNHHFMKHLEGFHNFVQEQINMKENGRGRSAHKKISDRYFREAFKKFCYRYSEWKDKITVDNSDSVHPWRQFQR